MYKCDTMGSIRFRLYWCHSEDSLSVLARNAQKGPEHETGSGGGKEGPREDRESQVTKERRREQSA